MDLFGDASVSMMMLLVFLATTTLALTVMKSVRVHGAVKRRAADRAGRCDVLADHRRRRHCGLSRPEPLSRPPHQGAPDGASIRLSGFHGPFGGLRRCWAEHGSRSRPGRARACGFLSLALRQY